MNLDEMQALWQGQGAGERDEATVRGLAAAVRSGERRHVRVAAIKTTFVAVILLVAVAWLVFGPRRPLLLVAGVVWCIAVAVAANILLWRARFAVSNLRIAESPVAFIDDALGALRRHDRRVRVYLLIMTACMVAGVNVMLASLSLGALPVAILEHAIVTAATIAAYLVGTRVRRRILGAENQRLRERLRAARHSFADE